MNFSVNLNIRDMYICNCVRETNTSNITVTSTSQTINLQNNYSINVVAVTSTTATVIIQNGTRVIIRKLYTNYPMNISLPTDDVCIRHLITLSISNIIVNV